MQCNNHDNWLRVLEAHGQSMGVSAGLHTDRFVGQLLRSVVGNILLYIGYNESRKSLHKVCGNSKQNEVPYYIL